MITGKIGFLKDIQILLLHCLMRITNITHAVSIRLYDYKGETLLCLIWMKMGPIDSQSCS